MPSEVQTGSVIFRRWDKQTGLEEHTAAFATLADLFELCLQTRETLLVDRVIIEGEDADGARRVVTLVFQSVTVHDDLDSSTSSAPGDA